MRTTITALLLFATTACADSVSGPPPGTRNVILSSVAPGVSGNALLAQGAGGVSTVWVTLQGLSPGVAYTGHVGRGICQDPGDAVSQLAVINTTTTVGSAVTGNVPDSVLQAGFHILYDGPGSPAPPVACGNIE